MNNTGTIIESNIFHLIRICKSLENKNTSNYKDIYQTGLFRVQTVLLFSKGVMVQQITVRI